MKIVRLSLLFGAIAGLVFGAFVPVVLSDHPMLERPLIVAEQTVAVGDQKHLVDEVHPETKVILERLVRDSIIPVETEIELPSSAKSGLTSSAKDVIVPSVVRDSNPLDRVILEIPAPFNPPSITTVNP